MARAKNPSLYRALHKLRKGGLHRALGVPEGETIPKSKVEAATHSKNAHVAKWQTSLKRCRGSSTNELG